MKPLSVAVSDVENAIKFFTYRGYETTLWGKDHNWIWRDILTSVLLISVRILEGEVSTWLKHYEIPALVLYDFKYPLFCWLCYIHRLWLHHTMNALFLSGCGFVIWDKFLLMWNFRDDSQLWNHKSVLFSAKKTATITQPLFSIGQVSHRNLDFSSTIGFCIHFWQHHCY